jgi:F-box protein 18 (helicase)
LIKRKWNDQDNVLIVSGTNNKEIAIRFGLYIAKNKRSFRPSRYIAFYNRGIIDAVAEIFFVFDDVNLAHDLYPGSNTTFGQYVKLKSDSERNFRDILGIDDNQRKTVISSTFTSQLVGKSEKIVQNVSIQPKSEIKPTYEQEDIIKKFGEGKHLLIRAFAGTGKTSTLRMITQAYPKRRFLYIVFNKAASQDAQKRFGSNVNVRTLHSLAFGFMVSRMNMSNLVNSYRIPTIADILGINYDYARAVKIIFDEFCYSNRMEIDNFDLDFIDSMELFTLVKTGAVSVGKALRYTQQFYQKMESGKIPVTHNFYLKQFQRLGIADTVQYDAILLDEAQDSNLITYDIVNSMKGQKVVIGDRHQKIYGFRNSLDISGRFLSDKAEEMPLTYSFRFHEGIASLANNLLSTFKEENMKIHGTAPHKEITNHAIITRTNAKIVEVIENIMKSTNWKTVRDPKELFKLPLSITKLFTNKRIDYEIPSELSFLERFKNIDDLENYAKHMNDIELMSATSIAKHKSSVIEKCFKKALDQFNLKDVQLYLTTAHTSKGLEWDNVYLEDDYPNIFKVIGKVGGIPKFIYMQSKGDSSDVEKIVEEINLLYVAVTRAREKVYINKIEESDTLFSGDMRKIIQKAEEHIPSPDTPKGPK